MLLLVPSTHIYKYEGVGDGFLGRLLLDECRERFAISLRTTWIPSRRAEGSMKVSFRHNIAQKAFEVTCGCPLYLSNYKFIMAIS